MGMFRSRDRTALLIAKPPQVFGSLNPDRNHVGSVLLPFLAELRIAFETGGFASREQPQDLFEAIKALPSERGAVRLGGLTSSGATYRTRVPTASTSGTDRDSRRDVRTTGDPGRPARVNTATLKRFENFIDIYWKHHIPGRDFQHAWAVCVRATIGRTLGGDSASFDKGVGEAVQILDLISSDGVDTTEGCAVLTADIAATRADYLSQKGL